MSHVGDKYDTTHCPEILKAFKRPSADFEATKDQWGEFISAYAPIHDKSGKAIAILGVDMSVANLRAEQHRLFASVFKTAIWVVLAAFVLSVLVTVVVLQRLGEFIDAADQVSSGNLYHRINVKWKDEIGDFANTFNSMVTSVQEARERIVECSSRDSLTGLYNHMYFHTKLEEELDRAKRYDRNLSVVMIDLDRFKSVNDTFGHMVGDSAVAQLASVLVEQLRTTDIAIRYGGDEFAVIIPEADSESATATAQRIREYVEKHDFLAVPFCDLIKPGIKDTAPRMRLTMTAGVASFPKDHDSKDGLAMAADIALCRAKHIRRNSVYAYETPESGELFDPQKLFDALHNTGNSAIASLTEEVDSKDRHDSGHSERVAEYAQQIAEAVDIDIEWVNGMRIAGLLHDIGKTGVPESILNKPGSLSDEERSMINQHPVISAGILRRAPQLDQILPAVLFHHERWDGKGYPDGLKGEQIPITARIMAIADSFDAMTSDRPYRKAMSVEEALNEILAGAGGQFDPDLVSKFIEHYSAPQEKAA
jgi:diguanylate cyclase (GGDEF)-like protein